jgi:hypothetical protein
VTNHPDIQTVDVAEALDIDPIMLYRWRCGSPMLEQLNAARQDQHISWASAPGSA